MECIAVLSTQRAHWRPIVVLSNGLAATMATWWRLRAACSNGRRDSRVKFHESLGDRSSDRTMMRLDLAPISEYLHDKRAASVLKSISIYANRFGFRSYQDY